ncbi:MAG TPA: rhomboid family intramembrane serine protease [Bacillales bacterium]|nr:rhomboid family intramembrane serine protease [Bacillales bacterium]
MFVRNEDFRSFLRNYPVVSVIIAINLLVFVIINFVPPLNDLLYRMMAQQNILVKQGDYWRLITPIFLHTGFAHVLFNSFWTVLFAPALERILGKGKFIIAYLLTGIIGNIATVFLQEPMLISYGASGAIFGLFGIFIYMVLFRKDLIDGPSSQIVIAIVIFSLISTFLTPQVNVVAHLFGLIGGLLLGPPLLARVPMNFSWQPSTIRRSGHYQNTDIAFKPDRWRKHQKRKAITKKIVWGLLGLFILFGLISAIF